MSQPITKGTFVDRQSISPIVHRSSLSRDSSSVLKLSKCGFNWRRVARRPSLVRRKADAVLCSSVSDISANQDIICSHIKCFLQVPYKNAEMTRDLLICLISVDSIEAWYPPTSVCRRQPYSQMKYKGVHEGTIAPFVSNPPTRKVSTAFAHISEQWIHELQQCSGSSKARRP